MNTDISGEVFLVAEKVGCDGPNKMKQGFWYNPIYVHEAILQRECNAIRNILEASEKIQSTIPEEIKSLKAHSEWPQGPLREFFLSLESEDWKNSVERKILEAALVLLYSVVEDTLIHVTDGIKILLQLDDPLPDFRRDVLKQFRKYCENAARLDTGFADSDWTVLIGAAALRHYIVHRRIDSKRAARIETLKKLIGASESQTITSTRPFVGKEFTRLLLERVESAMTTAIRRIGEQLVERFKTMER